MSEKNLYEKNPHSELKFSLQKYMFSEQLNYMSSCLFGMCKCLLQGKFSYGIMTCVL